MIEKAIIKWYYKEKPTDPGGRISSKKRKGRPAAAF